MPFVPGLLSLFMSLYMCKRKPGVCFMGPVSLSFGESISSRVLLPVPMCARGLFSFTFMEYINKKGRDYITPQHDVFARGCVTSEVNASDIAMCALAASP